MADFAVKTWPVTIEPHPDPEVERLELARVGDFRCVVGKGEYKTGDTVAYIPTDSILPDGLIAEMGLEGKLSGKHKNRVKTIRLRGQISQGLVYGMPKTPVGVSVTRQLGVTKYEPSLPKSMDGELWNARGMTLKFDIENIKLYPDAFIEGESVLYTEKLHGTWACFGIVGGKEIVTSKGRSAQGRALKVDEGVNDDNIYVKQYRKHRDKILEIGQRLTNLQYWQQIGKFLATTERIRLPSSTDFHVLGEIYGSGVQDLPYGAEQPEFRVFDVHVGSVEDGRYLDAPEMAEVVDGLLESVPVLGFGGFSKETLEKHTNAKRSTLADHIREGVVVRSSLEAFHPECGRKVLKSINDKYYMRKNKNQTEYQ